MNDLAARAAELETARVAPVAPSFSRGAEALEVALAVWVDG